jgi:hypothetical protein
MEWNDSGNVCGKAEAAETIPDLDAAESSSQPLTRNECDLAGMRWNDQANVCGESAGSATQAATTETSPVVSTVLINIDKATQRMIVAVDGTQRYDWPVSTGLPGYSTPYCQFHERDLVQQAMG